MPTRNAGAGVGAGCRPLHDLLGHSLSLIALKAELAGKLAAAIRAVHGGGRAVAPELALESGSGGQDPLSEREVLRLAGEAESSADIARLVHLSEGTVRNYLSEAISKLDAGNRVEAYRLARDVGWAMPTRDVCMVLAGAHA